MSTIHHARGYIAILVILQVSWMITPSILEIAIKVKEDVAFSSRVKRSTSACTNYAKVDPKNISYNQNPKPWGRRPAVTFVSDKVTQGMNKALTALVPGLGATTIKDVFDKLKQGGCVCFPFGGSVRDQFLGGKVRDIDADSPCDVHKIVEICIKHWDKKYCKPPHKTAKLQIVHIGEYKEDDGEEIDLANWNNSFFGSLTNLEYTTNSLGYYDDAVDNRGIVIDFPGSGVNDTCNKVIRIPVPRDQWDDWYHGDYWKIFRYWKLLAKGYDAEGNELPSFIKNKTKEILRKKPGRKVFRLSFFKYALSGDYKDYKNIAIVPYPTCLNVTQQNQKKSKYYALFEKVLGEYWENEVKELVDEIKIECPPEPSSTTTNAGDRTNWSLILILICVIIRYALC